MSLYVRLQTSFWNHRKTMRLRAAIGESALWLVPRLWSYAAENQPDGDFSGYSDDELALVVGYSGDATSMRQALLKAGFMDASGMLHDWAEHNSYHQSFSERAKIAAKARWEGEKKEKGKGDDKKGKETSIASSMLQASLDEMFKRNGSPWTYAEQCALIEVCQRPDVEAELVELKQFKAQNDYFPQSVNSLLSKWSETLDRARSAKTQKKELHPITGRPMQ